GEDKGQVTGKITFQGKSLPGGYFVTLVSGDTRFSSAIQKDGSFQFKTAIPPGEYRIAIEPIPGETKPAGQLPEHYRIDTTPRLTVQVRSGRQQLELNLPK